MMMNTDRRHLWRVGQTLILSLGLALGGCVWVEDVSDLELFVQQARAKPRGAIEPLPEFKPYHSFVYEGSSLRDPFKPLAALAAQSGGDSLAAPADTIKPDLQRQRGALEAFALDRLQMVGTIRAGANRPLRALVKDELGQVHMVSKGHFMGLDHGRVVAIKEDRLELVEIISNGRGGWMKRPRNLMLQVKDNT